MRYAVSQGFTRPDTVSAPFTPFKKTAQATKVSYPPFGGKLWPSVTVVVPTLNEAENLPYVLPKIPEWVAEVILVDGHSTDNTIEVARELRSDIRIVMQQGRGKGAALRTGFQAAKGEIIVMIDADGSTGPEEIPAFVGALLAGADYAKGSRFLQGGGTADMPLYRKLGNWGFVKAVSVLFGGNFSDLLYGYNAFWTHILPCLGMDADGFEIETLMNVRALKAGLRIVEVPSFEAPRVFGEGRLKAFPDGMRVLKTLIREWRDTVAILRIPAQPTQDGTLEDVVLGTNFDLEN